MFKYSYQAHSVYFEAEHALSSLPHKILCSIVRAYHVPNERHPEIFTKCVTALFCEFCFLITTLNILVTFFFFVLIKIWCQLFIVDLKSHT